MQYLRKTINNYPNYEVDSNGNIYNKTQQLAIQTDPNGYCSVMLYNNDGAKRLLIHRLVMMNLAPIENMDMLEVNHKDGVKTNNHIDNLEWCTGLQNLHHAGLNGLTSKCIPVTVCNIFDNSEVEYPSCQEASNNIGISADSILYRLSYPNNTIFPGGWRFKRFNDEWIELNNFTYDDVWNGGTNKVHLFNVLTGHDLIVKSQRDASVVTSLSESFLSTELSSGNQRILPGMWMIKRPSEEWRVVEDIWLDYELNSPYRPVICTFPTGGETVFESLEEVSRYTGINKTTICYRLNAGLLSPGRNGYAFEYYSDRVRRLGN